MEGSKKVMESLEFLWFFKNVLTLPAFQHKDDHVAEEPSKHKIDQEVPRIEILVPRCPKCSEIAVGFEQQTVPPINDVEFAKLTEKPETRRRRTTRRKTRLIKKKFFVDCNLASESWFYEETYGYEYPNFETHGGYTKIPSLNDGLAMKEHLRSWAYAVTCTVR